LKAQGKIFALAVYPASYPPEPPNHNFKERAELGYRPAANRIGTQSRKIKP
jgi:hypothetical protein